MKYLNKKLIVAISLALGGLNTHAAGPVFTTNIEISTLNPSILFTDISGINDSTDWQICIDFVCSLNPVGPFLPKGSFNLAMETDGNVSSRRRPLTIHNNARTDALRLLGNNIGMGTATPAEELHIFSPNLGLTPGTPAIRLEGANGANNIIPGRTWDIDANFAAFIIKDQTAGTLPFRVERDTPSNSLTVDTTGNIGVGTSSPVEELHIFSPGAPLQPGQPTIRLEGANDTTNNILGRTWDIDAGFFGLLIRDQTAGTLPFRVESESPSDSLTVDTSGSIGMGTSNPTSALHIRQNDAAILVEDTNVNSGNRQLLNMRNNGGIGMRFNNTDNGSVWDFNNTNSGNFTASKVGTGGFEFEVQGNGRFKIRSFGELNFDMRADGNLHIPNGDVIVGGTTLNVPDYVFEHDYELMPLDELKTFVAKNKHLPNVASEAEIKKAKQVSIAKSHMTHLEKIEELTLYTIEQHEQIKSLKTDNALMKKQNIQMQKQLDNLAIALNTDNSHLKERLASLEKLVTNLAMGKETIGKGDELVLK